MSNVTNHVNIADAGLNSDGSRKSADRNSSRARSRFGPIGSKRRKRSRRIALVVAASLALIAPAAMVIGRSHGTGSANWTTARVSRHTIASTVTATGTVDPVSTVQVGSYVSGPITAIYADYNSAVTAGELIAKIDPRPFQMKVDEAKAALANATAQLHKDVADEKYKQLAYQRYSGLLKKKAVSQDAVDSAQSAFAQATAQVELDHASIQQQQASLRDAELNLKYTDILSPVNGTVIAREVDVGQTVAASFQTPTLFLIAKDLTKMQVDSNVSEADIGEIREGQKATFTVDAYDKSFEGRVTQVRRNPTTVQNVVTYDVVIAADNSQMMLAPGMTANVKITKQEHRNALRVPLQAIQQESRSDSPDGSAEPTREFVWTVDGRRRESVAVRTGIHDAKYVEVFSDRLHEGDLVVVGPIEATESTHTNQLPPPQGMP